MVKIIIVGSGIAGIACSIRLALSGHQVIVIEANDYPGGKLTEIRQGAYRFDAGPSLFTMPQLVDELFELAGKHPKKHFSYFRLESSGNYFYEDGTSFSSFQDHGKLAQELSDKLGVDSKPVFSYLKRAAFRYRVCAPVFLEQSLHKAQNYFSGHVIKGAISMFRLGLFGTMNKENEAVFRNKHLVQYFNRYATYNGSSPYKAPALLNMISHLEHNMGAFFPANGMFDITQSLFMLAKDCGVDFIFNTSVEQIVVQENKVSGVLAQGKWYDADLVISNADISTTYHKLLKTHKPPLKTLRQERSSSALIFYWGIKHAFANLDLHNIFFSSNYESEFDHLFHKKTIFSDPTVYINITSKYKPDDAPAGCENWFVMINVPGNSGQDWDLLIKTARKNIIDKLNRMLKTDIEPLIEVEDILDPRLIESRTSSSAGALYGSSSNNRFAAFLRHKNFSSNIKGLYFCGGSVHPGGGIPLALYSAKIVAGLIQKDCK